MFKTLSYFFFVYFFIIALAGVTPAFACPDIDGLVDINCDGKVIVVAFGDSITRGVGDSTKRGYPGRLQRLLDNVKIINVGDPGERTSEGRVRAPREFNKYKNADYTIVLEGVNDYHEIGRSASSTRANLSSIVRSAENRGAVTLLGKLTDVKRDFQRPWVLAVNQKIGRAAKIDFFKLGKSIISFDKLHPDGEGYQEMAVLARRELLKESEKSRPRDSDNDGIYDFAEAKYGTNKNLADSDGDGISDGVEIFTYGSNPLSTDSDGDGVSDGEEVSRGTNPASARPGAPTIESLELLPPA